MYLIQLVKEQQKKYRINTRIMENSSETVKIDLGNGLQDLKKSTENLSEMAAFVDIVCEIAHAKSF